MYSTVRWNVNIICNRFGVIKYNLVLEFQKLHLFYSASELQAWLLYYGLSCLAGYLPNKYLNHFAHLAEGIYILLGYSISQETLARAQDLLMRFYRDFEGLYGEYM